MMGKNRSRFFLLPFIVLICLLAPNAFAEEIYYDTFTSDFLDQSKWAGEEVVREVQNGKFVSYVRTFGVDRSAKIAASGSPYSLEAIVTLKDISDTNIERNCAGIQQAVFNDGSDIIAYLNIGRYQGLYMSQWIVVTTEGEMLASGTLGSVTLKVPYKLRIESYRQTGALVFAVDDQTETVSFSKPMNEANSPYFAIGNITQMDENGYALINATYDNVSVDEEIYDIFSKKDIDETKWSFGNLETVDEVRNGKLYFKFRNSSGGGGSLYNMIRNSENVHSIKCSGSVRQLESDDEAMVVFRILGSFYNTSEDTILKAVMAIGDISWDGTDQLKAYAELYEYNDVTGAKTLSRYIFGNVSPQARYEMGVDYHDQNKFTFSLDGKTYDVAGPPYFGPSTEDHLSIGVSIYTSDFINMIVADADNVVVNGD